MIQLTRRASVAIALCVLTSAATASAECAWVLWEMSQIQNPSNPHLATRVYGTIGAWGTEDECKGTRQVHDGLLRFCTGQLRAGLSWAFVPVYALMRFLVHPISFVPPRRMRSVSTRPKPVRNTRNVGGSGTLKE